MAATAREYQEGFLAGAYLLSLLEHNTFAEIKGLGIGGRVWSDRMVDELAESGLIEPPPERYFFEDTPVVLTDAGEEKALALILEPGNRVPETVLLAWRLAYMDYGGSEHADEGIIPSEIVARLEELEDAYLRFKQEGQPNNNRSRVEASYHDSSRWTGRRSTKQQAAFIRRVAPIALNGVELLIGELESLGHNGGPSIEERKEALTQLRDLQSALAELIKLAENDLPTMGALSTVRALQSKLFTWCDVTFSISAPAAGLAFCKAAVVWGVASAINGMIGGGGEAVGALASQVLDAAVSTKERKASGKF